MPALFFQKSYLELVWVIDEDEIKNPVIERTKMWERSQHEFTGYCPFGLCFRAVAPSRQLVHILFENGWQYHSAYLPEGQYANIASNEAFPAEPMLFEMPFFGLPPKDYPLEKQQPLIHTNGFQELTKVTLTIPQPLTDFSPAMEKVLRESIVHVSLGDNYSVALEFDDGGQGKIQDFTALIPLILKG